ALAPFVGAWVVTTHGSAAWGLGGTAAAGILVTLAVGALVGSINGFAATTLRVPPFIATLGMMSAARGLVYIVSNGTPISSGIPPGFMITGHNLVSVRAGGPTATNLTVAVLVMAVVFAMGQVILARTAVGRQIYAIGGNETGARLSGIPVDRIKLLVYIAAGALAAVGGLVETATVGAAVPDAGTDLELNAIAAVVIGGTSLTGGRGSLAGTFAGALLMRVIRNGLNLVNVDSNWQRVAIGTIIVVSVAFDELQKRRSAGV
ncbi:MAG TPA: ABC transporter permease, partial [Chthonomonadales bacterium]|nr:ABC transporter permease [Chthonomonadales bacterium]